MRFRKKKKKKSLKQFVKWFKWIRVEMILVKAGIWSDYIFVPSLDRSKMVKLLLRGLVNKNYKKVIQLWRILNIPKIKGNSASTGVSSCFTFGKYCCCFFTSFSCLQKWLLKKPYCPMKVGKNKSIRINAMNFLNKTLHLQIVNWTVSIAGLLIDLHDAARLFSLGRWSHAGAPHCILNVFHILTSMFRE